MLYSIIYTACWPCQACTSPQEYDGTPATFTKQCTLKHNYTRSHVDPSDTVILDSACLGMRVGERLDGMSLHYAGAGQVGKSHGMTPPLRTLLIGPAGQLQADDCPPA